MARIYFNTWGDSQSLNFADYAMQKDETKLEAVCRSIQRTTGLTVCGEIKNAGWSNECGRIVNSYQVALGRVVRGNGYEVKAVIWVVL